MAPRRFLVRDGATVTKLACRSEVTSVTFDADLGVAMVGTAHGQVRWVVQY